MLIATRTCCSTCAHDCTAAVLPHTNRSNLRGRAVPAPTPTCEPPLPVSFLWMRPHQGLACPMARFNTSHLTVRPGGQCPPLRPPANRRCQYRFFGCARIKALRVQWHALIRRTLRCDRAGSARPYAHLHRRCRQQPYRLCDRYCDRRQLTGFGRLRASDACVTT